MRFGTILFVVFLILKLCGTICWSWWWVTAPLWIPLVIGLCIILLTGLEPDEFIDKLK